MQDGPYREIPLRRRDGSIYAYTKVSPEDYAELSRHRWKRTGKGYVIRQTPRSGGGQVSVRMSRVIMGLERSDSRHADHINRDKLDNRRGNLRILTNAENQQNVPARGGTSPYRGVCLNRRTGGWIASVGQYRAGTFASEEAAAEAARRARMVLFPFAVD